LLIHHRLLFLETEEPITCEVPKKRLCNIAPAANHRPYLDLEKMQDKVSYFLSTMMLEPKIAWVHNDVYTNIALSNPNLCAASNHPSVSIGLVINNYGLEIQSFILFSKEWIN